LPKKERSKVKDLTDYSNTTSEHELFAFFYDRIIARDITTFSALTEFAEPILRDRRCHPVMMRCFELIQRLYWGFFAGISYTTHKKLWRELVIPDQDFREAGDLKRTISISNLYISMMDIHGYTKFCQESRNNLSKQHALDRAINNEIRHISSQCHSVSRRERGDEILLVSASATDALTATLCIMDFFAKTNVVNDPSINTQQGDEAANLPVFKISAGITGGNTSIPLIITEAGDLSGFLLNTAARLQNRANELSPRESRVMVTKQLQLTFDKENSVQRCVLHKNNAVYFFDTGLIEFKGVQLPTCEAVFKSDDRYKQQFSEEMNRLFASTKDGLWEQRVYVDLMDLISKVCSVMPKFSVTPRESVHGMVAVNNDSMMQLCHVGVKSYTQDEDYSYAVELLRRFIELIDMIPEFDRLILDYVMGIAEKYELLLDDYQASIDKEIEDKAALIFTGNYLKSYHAAKNAVGIYKKLQAMGQKSPALAQKKNIWYNLIRQNKDNLVFTLHSGKK
jgi:hypothetical protein